MFFFFQAEDGIRDYKVTGVQTCALPISSTLRGNRAREGGWLDPHAAGPEGCRRGAGPHRRRDLRRRTGRRSEERRVGKEGRARGWPEQAKKERGRRERERGESQHRMSEP